MNKTKKLATCSILLALALVLSFFESTVFPSVLPLPGVKLGLSNIVTLFSLYALGCIPCAVILILRCIVASFFGGGLTALFFSLTGGVLALITMMLIKSFGAFSIYGVSISGSAAHSIGQILAAALIFGSSSIFMYLPVMLFASLFTGVAIAFVTHFLLIRIQMYKK